jgi:hypothetical protein
MAASTELTEVPLDPVPVVVRMVTVDPVPP